MDTEDRYKKVLIRNSIIHGLVVFAILFGLGFCALYFGYFDSGGKVTDEDIMWIVLQSVFISGSAAVVLTAMFVTFKVTYGLSNRPIGMVRIPTEPPNNYN